MSTSGYQVVIERRLDYAIISVRASAPAQAALEQHWERQLPCVGDTCDQPAEQGSVLGLGPDEWLIVVALDNEQRCFDKTRAVVAGHHASVVVMTDGYVVFSLRGDDCVDVLSQVVSVDLHAACFSAGAVARLAFAKVSAVLHCIEPGRHYEIYADSTLEDYVHGYLSRVSGAELGRRG